MRMIARIQAIRLGAAQLQIHIGHGLIVIHEAGLARSARKVLGRLARIPDEPHGGSVSAVDAALPEVVGRLRGEDDGGALGDERFGGRLDVVVECVDFFAGFARGTHFRAGARAVGAAVVGGRVGRAAVVVAKLNHDNVAGFYDIGELGEAAFIGVGAGRAAGNGLVDDGDAGEERGKVFTPSC